MAEQSPVQSWTSRPSTNSATNVRHCANNDVSNQHKRFVSRLAERGYSIAIGTATLAEAGRFLRNRARRNTSCLITDANVHPLHGLSVADSLAKSGATVHTIIVEPGEQAKSAAVAESLWRQLLELGADRKTVVAALGGGVVGDLAGFVAATYARGLGAVANSHDAAWLRSIARSAAKSGSICRRRRTWSAHFGNRWEC